MDRTGSMELWPKLLAGVVPGKMTVRQWCEEQGVSLNEYYYWRRRIRAVAAANPPKARPLSSEGRAWLTVQIDEPIVAPVAPSRLSVCITLEGYPGAAIDVVPGFDPSLLRAVVEALRSRSC